ncbi:MAG: beta-lactamase family protein [Polyangiaceae bacterium]|nr:beta-lactamase family protein [Polyangiaceae bacterium]
MILRGALGLTIAALVCAVGGCAPSLGATRLDGPPPATPLAVPGPAVRPSAPADGPSAAPSVATPPVAAEPAPAPAPLVDPGLPEWLPVAAPEDVHLGPAALAALVAEAERTASDALVVLSEGKLVVERYFGKPRGPIQTMSITKGFVGLAIGILLGEGKLHSIDLPVGTWLPDWRYNDYAKVTLRHVLTHTSGLYHEEETYPLTQRTNRLSYARNLPLVSEPGQVFAYNNEATLLLAGVVERAAGMPLDDYLRRKLFEPLGIGDVRWERDAAGTPATYSGLALEARDLAKVGALLLAGGEWQGRSVVPSTWLTEAAKPSAVEPTHGLLTWLLREGPYYVQTAARREALGRDGLDAAAKLAHLDGRRFESREAYWLEVGAALDADERHRLAELLGDERLPFDVIPARLVGYAYRGWLGQYLLVYPAEQLVVVRLRREPPRQPPGSPETELDAGAFEALPRLAAALHVPAPAPVAVR